LSYRLRILRAHGLVAKIQRSHRYLLTTKGRKAITALLTAQQATINQLTKEVA
jgi:DNA-binding MarR family transcriptional regulator